MFGPEGARSSRIVLRGSVDVTVSSQLLDAARQAAVAGRDAIVDGSEITRLDLSAVQILLALSSGMRGGTVHIGALSPSGRRFLEIAGVADLFPVEPLAAEPLPEAVEPSAAEMESQPAAAESPAEPAPPAAEMESRPAEPAPQPAPPEEPASPRASAGEEGIHEMTAQEYDESAWDLVAAEGEPAGAAPVIAEAKETDVDAPSGPLGETSGGAQEGAPGAPANDEGEVFETQGTQG